MQKMSCYLMKTKWRWFNRCPPLILKWWSTLFPSHLLSAETHGQERSHLSWAGPYSMHQKGRACLHLSWDRITQWFVASKVFSQIPLQILDFGIVSNHTQHCLSCIHLLLLHTCSLCFFGNHLHCWHKFCVFQLSNSSCQAHFLKLNNVRQCIQANNYPHRFSASKCKTTATEERKLGLIIKMCQVWVHQLFLFNKPCCFIVWLAFLGHRLSLTQALTKCTAFVTKWRTISLSLTLPPLLRTVVIDEGWLSHHFETSLHCRHS